MAAARRSPPDVAYERVREIALRFPGAEEKLSHGAPSFHVRGKMYLTFVDDHHGDGRLAVWCKSTVDEQRRLVASRPDHHGDGAIAACIKGDRREHARAIAADPARYYLPAYVGPRGYLGVRLDARRVDWKDIADRVAAANERVAPRR